MAHWLGIMRLDNSGDLEAIAGRMGHLPLLCYAKRQSVYEIQFQKPISWEYYVYKMQKSGS